MFDKNLSASLEDYLELIHNLLKKNSSVRAIDISKTLNVSRASVSEALTKLSQKNLIVYKDNKEISMTTEGLEKACEIIEKHEIFTGFFEKILGLDRLEAEQNACRIEHVVSNNLFNKIKSFKNYCENNNDIVRNFREGILNE